MRHFIFYMVLLGIGGCTFLEKSTNYPSVILDETILDQCTRDVPKIEGTWSPSLKLARQIEVDLPQLNGSEVEDLPGFEIKELDVSGYTYQYAGVIVDGKELVYINAFYNLTKVHNDVWQIQRVNVCYGYARFWGALYDPESRSFSDLTFNEANEVRPSIDLFKK